MNYSTLAFEPPRHFGRVAAPFEITDDEKFQDILDPLGFTFGLSLCIRLLNKAHVLGLVFDVFLFSTYGDFREQ